MKCLAAHTRRAARGLTRLYEEHLAPSGLTTAQFTLLSQLVHRTGCSQQELCEATGLDQTTLSRNLRLMTEHGWVKRAASANDKRAASYRVTTKGAALHARAMPLWEAAQRQMRHTLGAEWQQAFTLLQQLSEVAQGASLR